MQGERLMRMDFIDYVMGTAVLLFMAAMTFVVVWFSINPSVDTDHCIRNETGRYCLVEE